MSDGMAIFGFTLLLAVIIGVIGWSFVWQTNYTNDCKARGGIVVKVAEGWGDGLDCIPAKSLNP